MPLTQKMVRGKQCHSIATAQIRKNFKGAVGAYWGCCRGCGAHLIWVTSIDAFSCKKSLLARIKTDYFTVLHKMGYFEWFSHVPGTSEREKLK